MPQLLVRPRFAPVPVPRKQASRLPTRTLRAVCPTGAPIVQDRPRIGRTGSLVPAFPMAEQTAPRRTSDPAAHQVDEPAEDTLPVGAQAVVLVLIGNPR